MDCTNAQRMTLPTEQCSDPRQMLEDLLAAGLTHLEIGKEIGCSHSSVSRMRAGKQGVDYFIGKGIERLHRRMCPTYYEQLAAA